MPANFGYSEHHRLSRRAGYSSRHFMGVGNVLNNVLDAIRAGDWYFEPEETKAERFQATSAIPGSEEKLSVLAARVRAGLPLWHENDRADYESLDLDH